MAAGSTGGRRSVRQGGAAPFTLTVTIDGARETLKAFRDLPKDASNALRDAAGELSVKMAADIAAAGAREGRQAAAVARTVKAGRRDRVPNVVIGGTQKIGRHGEPAFKLLFGSEFGAGGGKGEGDRYAPYGYKRHAGKRGLWIFPTVEAGEAKISRAWNAAADEIIKRFTMGGE